jgi:hypothetical protein
VSCGCCGLTKGNVAHLKLESRAVDALIARVPWLSAKLAAHAFSEGDPYWLQLSCGCIACIVAP